MSETDHGDERQSGSSDARQRGDRRDADDAVEVIAASTVRVLLGVLGVLLLLFAMGQVMGFDAMAILSDALDTPEARWMLVALFALVLIVISLRGFR